MRSAFEHQRTKLRVAGAVLEDHDQRRLQLSFLVFSVAELATWVAILVYGYRIGEASAVGLVAVAQLVPAAVLAPPLTALADRTSRRTALAGGYAAQSVFAIAAGAAMAADAAPAFVVALAAAYSVFLSATRSVHGAAIPDLSDSPRTALAANALTALAEGSGVFIGPLLAGLVLLAGPEHVFFAMGAGLLASCLAVVTMRGGRRRPDPDPEGAEHRSGLVTLARNREVRTLVSLAGVAMVVVGALDVLLVVLAVEVLGIGESGTGYLNSLVGVGSLAGGAVAIGLVGRPRLGRAVGTGAVAMGAPLVLVSVLPAAALLLPITGFGRTYGDVAARTLLQRVVPPGVLARAFGVLESMAMSGLAVGAILAPVLLSAVGPAAAFLVVGAVVPAGFLVAAGRIRLADRTARVPSEALAVLTAVEPFTVLDPPELEALALDAELRVTVPGETVIRKGDHGDRAFVVVEGRYRVVAGVREVAVLEPGSLFGEIALLADVPRTATVVSDGPGRLLALHREAFLDVVGRSAATRGAVSAVARTRLDELAGLDD